MNIRFGKTIFFVLIFTLFSTPFFSQANIVGNLKLGDTSNQVMVLQKILNSRPETQISSGLGSSGYETTYFGLKTREAVIRFQNLYSNEILIPAGLLSGNGFVGPLTLKKLNSLGTHPQTVVSNVDSAKVQPSEAINIYETDQKISAVQKRIVDEIASSVTENRAINSANVDYSALSAVSKVFLNQIQPQESVVGNQVSVGGYGLTSDNTLYLGPNYVIRNVPAIAGALKFTIPTVPVGVYPVVIKNSNGISNSSLLVVKEKGAQNSIVTGFSPKTAVYGDIVTLMGKNFTTDNTVVCTHGTFSGVVSSGTSLQVPVEPASLKAFVGKKIGREWPVDCYVVNSNGFSSGVASFIIKY